MAKSLKKLLLSIGCLLLIPGIVCGASTPVNWSIPSIKSKITIGEQKKLLVTFTSQAKLQNVEIWVVPKLQPFIKIEPNKFKSISAKVGYQLEISLFAPPEVRADVYKGTIHLRVGNRTYPMPLQAELDVHPIENRPPVAMAGQYPTAEVNSAVTLDGSQSYDPDGDLITYNWSFVSIPQESSTSLGNPTSAKATFTPDAEGVYEISLQVNDSKGAVDQDITIVEAFLPNVPPVAEAGANQTAVTGLKVCLDGSQSSDKDGDSLTFLWTMVSLPDGSNASLDNSISARPCFTPDKDGQYTFRLVVDDGISESVPDDVSIDAASPNAPPVANAGEDRTISKNNVITLDGTGSYDPDNDPLTYNWSIISKPLDSTSVLTGSTSSKPTILADKEGIFVFHLLVEDSWYRSAYDDVAITVINDPPVALIETAGTQVMNEVITLDGTKSSDPNRDNLSFAWLIRTAPGGSSCAIANSSAASTTIRPDRPGRYIIDLTVNDGSLTDTDFTSLDIGVRVPNLVGLTRAQAEDLIRQSFLAVGSASYDANTAPAGQVINQTPAEQTIVPGGTSVSIVLSTGTQTPLPPDPSTVATQIDPTVATTVAASTSFLYSGSNPIQSGVVPGAIEPKRQGVLRGKVINRDETPLPGVTIRILGRLDYGQTLSRSDGMFDMAVNGGETIVVEFSRPGYLTAQRQVVSPTQDYGFIADVVLIPKDSIATAIDLTSSLPMQTAQGTIINDSSGTRKGVLLFPSGTTAEAVLTNDSVQPLTNINVRITEYSTGPSGPKAMPAKLPPTVGYTYCVEFGVDQADALGAKEVRFSQPLYHYVNNFLNFPVGMIVPVAYYDRAKAAWIPSDNGKVIKITGVNSGIAVLDTTGTNVDNGAALGITEAERRAIATLFNIGDSLWRAPITHFTPWDLNWGVWLPTDAVGPQVPAPVAATP